MEPSKQETVSRQSSILKAPKQRQPLQCVATNSPSAESSPTIKIKRRVSFARNKRIREFCNEVEPKEGLDDSYEEHDLSNTKSSNGNSTDHPLVISVACEDKENFPIQLFLPTDQFECKEIPRASAIIGGDDLAQHEMEMDNSINDFPTASTETHNKEETLTNATIYFDDGMDITSSVQPQIISTQVQGESCDDTVPVSQTYIEDIPMEITENLPTLLPKKIMHVQDTNHPINFEYDFSNFTDPISTILGIGNMKRSIESQSTKLHTENATECFTDMPLEFTSVIPSSTWIKPQSNCTNNDETERLNCKTMEFTEVVQRHIMHAQKDSPSNESLKQIQHDKIHQGKDSSLCDNSLTNKEATFSPNLIYPSDNSSKHLLEKMQEKTNIFSNASIEITEAIPVCNVVKKLPIQMKEVQKEYEQEKTKIFCDQSLELTGVPNNEIYQLKYSEKRHVQTQEQTKLFLDASMEMTEAIPNCNKIGQYVNPQNKVLDTNKTKVFFNTSMDMTEAVPTYLKINQPVEVVEKTHPGKLQDKTKLFNDNSMELTEALKGHHIKESVRCKIQFNAPRNEKTQLFLNASMEMTEAVPVTHTGNKPIHPRKIQDKTKLFNDNSMELTEALKGNNIKQSDHCRIQFNALRNEKTQLFINTSMEMTEAVPITHIGSKPIFTTHESGQELAQDKTKLFYDKSMEVTEAVLHHNPPSPLSNFDNQTLETRQEKTKVFFNASMEMTEAVPVDNRGNKSILTANEIGEDIAQDKTKLFHDKSMEVMEAALHHNKILPLSKLNNQTLEPRQEKTKLFFNGSMEMTEAVPTLLSKISQPFEDVNKIHEDDTLKNSQLSCSKSIEITESVPVIHPVNQSAHVKEKNHQEITQDRTKIFQNKSMEVTEAALDYYKSDAFSSFKNQALAHEQEKTEFFHNASMEMTEAAPVVNRLHQLRSEPKSKNIPEQTEIFQDKSMEITEAIKNFGSNNYCFEQSMEKSKFGDEMQEKENVLPSCTSITETTPIVREIWQCDPQNNEVTSKQSKQMLVNDRVMDQSRNLFENIATQAVNSDNKTMSMLRDEKTKFFNKSMDFTEILPGFGHQNAANFVQSNVSNMMTEKTKLFFDNSMEVTEPVIENSNLYPTNPPILSNSVENLERLHPYESILPNKMNVQNSINNTKQSIHKSTYKEKSFQRMTTDELNTLCASMNLPTQNYTTEKSSTLQNDYMSICNDVNVLRDSLQKNTIFQQNFTIGSDMNTMGNNMHMPTDVTENLKKAQDLQIFSKTNSESLERSVTSCREKSQKECTPMSTHILNECNEIIEVKSMETGIRNLEYQNMFSDSMKSMTTPINRNGAESSNHNFFSDSKQTGEIHSNIYGLAKNETLQIQHNSVSLPITRKSSVKRKSTEMIENIATAENSLTRLPSDNTDFLIATMGVKTQLPHPLIINDRTIIKIPRMPTDNDTCTLSSISNEALRTGEVKESLKNIPTSILENELFDEQCNSSNKENDSPERKESIVRTELFSENSMNGLEEIQPPSFLCSDSFQTDSLVDAEMLDNQSTDEIPCEISQEKVNLTSEKQYSMENDEQSNSKDSNAREKRDSSEKDFSSSNSKDRVDTAKHSFRKSNEPVNKLVFFNDSKDVNESMISLINEENVNTDPLAPFLALTKSIEAHEKRDDCIWSIRKIDQKTVAVDFISKSFVTIIRLNEIEKACIKDIDNIEFISRLHYGSKNILLKIVHRLLLSKLNADELLSEYKMYEDVLPLIDCVSKEVILALDFIFDIERLSALNILSVENERVTFMVSSKKANIILEISLVLKIFNDIGPDDISVTCVLGDIRISDIKQLIVNIRKDSTFLSRYINDVRDYIMIMEESTHMQR